MKTLQLAALAALATVALTACPAAVEQEVKKDPLAAPPPPPKEASPKELFEQAVAAFDAGRLDEARDTFAKVDAKVPNNLVVKFNLGVIAERQGRLQDALAAYEAAHKIDGRHKPTLLNLGRVYRLLDKFEQAIALYEAAIKEAGEQYDVELNNNLTVAYRLAKKYDKAEATARRVLARTKDNPDAYKNLALIYYDMGNYRLAEFISANARKLDAKDPGVYNNLGLVYLKLDDRRLALGQFQKAVALNKDFAPGLFNIGAMALGYRDYDGAEKVLARATALDPNSYEGFLAYAWALDGQKGRDPKKGVAAGQVFERVLAIKPDQADAICGAGWAYAADRTGWDKAMQFLEKCKGLPSTSSQDLQLLDNKMKGILAMQKQPAAAPPPPKDEKKQAAPTKQGADLLEKVSEAAAAENAAEGDVKKDEAKPEDGTKAEEPKKDEPKKDEPKAEEPKKDAPPPEKKP